MSWDLNWAAKLWDSVVMMSNKCPQQVAFLFWRHKNNQCGILSVVDHRKLSLILWRILLFIYFKDLFMQLRERKHAHAYTSRGGAVGERISDSPPSAEPNVA